MNEMPEFYMIFARKIPLTPNFVGQFQAAESERTRPQLRDHGGHRNTA